MVLRKEAPVQFQLKLEGQGVVPRWTGGHPGKGDSMASRQGRRHIVRALGFMEKPSPGEGGPTGDSGRGVHAGVKPSSGLTRCSIDSWDGAQGKGGFAKLLYEALKPQDPLSA